jgi:FkbM family methyltransferase
MALTGWSRSLKRQAARLQAELRYGHIRRTSLETLVAKKRFEPELKIVPALLDRDAGPSFDVGAHIGHYTYVLRSAVSARLVHAFEPHPVSYATLERLFPDVNLWNCALSDQCTKQDLRIPYLADREIRTRGTLEPTPEPGETGSATVRVETTTLDQFTQDHGIEGAAFIKIDVEGHELKVIQGAQRTLSRHRPTVLIEIEQRHHQENIDHIFETVLKSGYRGCFLDCRQRALVGIDRFSVATMQRQETMNSIDYVNNFLFIDSEQYAAVTSRVERSLE